MLSENKNDSSVNQENNNPAYFQFPNEFYCPITEEKFRCPVVLSDGDSYERTAIERFGYLPSRLHSNRSLQKIIKESTSTGGKNGILNNEEEMKKNTESCKSTINHHQPLPDVFFCPITMDLMTDPVIDKDGLTYERHAIMQWIQVKGSSPITREVASTKEYKKYYCSTKL